MVYSVDNKTIYPLLLHQLESHFPVEAAEKEAIMAALPKALIKCEENFLHNPYKYYTRTINGKKKAFFNPYHSDMWSIFLYYLNNVLYTNNMGGY